MYVCLMLCTFYRKEYLCQLLPTENHVQATSAVNFIYIVGGASVGLVKGLGRDFRHRECPITYHRC